MQSLHQHAGICNSGVPILLHAGDHCEHTVHCDTGGEQVASGMLHLGQNATRPDALSNAPASIATGLDCP